MELILYHGTTPENYYSILKQGFKITEKEVSDPGDFGRGIYLTGMKGRAKAYGKVITVEVNLENPLIFHSVSEAYKWREKLIEKFGDTIHGKGSSIEERLQSRREAAEKWRNYFLEKGIDGIIIYDKYWGEEPYEVVVFIPEKIKVYEHLV